MKNEHTIENIDLILYSLKRPAIFSIQKVEDFFIFFNGYAIGRNDSVVIDFLDSFNQFVKSNYSEKNLKNYNSEKIIRLHSANDANSLQLLSLWINEFVKKK